MAMAITLIPSLNAQVTPGNACVNILRDGFQINSSMDGISAAGHDTRVVIEGRVPAENTAVLLIGSGATNDENAIALLETGRIVAQNTVGVGVAGDDGSIVNRGEVSPTGRRAPFRTWAPVSRWTITA